MRKMKQYPIHPRTICAELTTNKNLCGKHLRMALHPGIAPVASRLNIYADYGGNSGRRRENINTLR